jgi:phosphoglucomutase
VCFAAQDKDGVSGAAVFAEMVGELARKGLTISQHLEELYRTYGYVLTNNRYVFVDDPRKTVAIFKRLRNEGASVAVVYPCHR